ncbi:unnamed protein product [Brachionus calyciflorus]|uniref:UBC core domain-containing protein n=1 Tax=Brachionus calyciflorus TaxID=104777 RepID=A0A814AD42_9BILA|nr:unnamed protein product [Brachionus calyciflorus]
MYDEFKLDDLIPNTDSIRLVSHNSVLNCLFILTNDTKLYLFDCNTRTKLKEINLQNKIDLNYNYFKILNIQDKCIIVSDRTICSRLANEGLFLLDSVLQASTLNLSQTNTPEIVFRTLELSLNDAINLVQSLKLIECDSIEGLDTLIKQIDIQIDCLNKLDDTSWLTVQITENYFTLLTLLTQCLDEIKRTCLQSVAIPIISLLLDRLYRLDSNLIEKQIHGGVSLTGGGNFDKRYMCSEATRRATFNEWPHMDYKWVLPDALAQAGFYHQPTHPGDDRTICFVCDLCLVAWEQHDQPWSEHERHSPACQFVRGELTDNVPLSLTAATQAANLVYKSNDPKDTVVCTSELSSERYFAVSNSSGHIIVYDSKDILKEMMHVQLINESQYNKDHKLKIHSLCFYYRNHKHVLYGSFTINDEVFIFSFNIFDIYRSYHSKSNKKTSKTHKTSSNSAPTKSSSTNPKASQTITTSTTTAKSTLQTTPIFPPPVIQETKTMETVITNELKNNDLSQLVTQDVTLFSEGAEFQKYMNNIIKLDSDLPPPKPEIPEPVTLQHQLSSENSTKNNSDDASDLKELKKTPSLEKDESVKSKAETNSAQLSNFLNNHKNLYYDNMFSLIINSEGQKMSQNTNSFDLFTLPKTQPMTLPKQLGSFQAALTSQSNQKTTQALNLSNFLNVRFEITPLNQQAQQTTAESSKSKSSKYKKTIKILTVSCRPLSALHSNEPVPDIQLKSYEFTEKCLSFRLASIDLASEPRTSFDIKLINLYEKYLCALVNFKNVQTGLDSFKLFRIKHEETSSSSSNMTNINSGSSVNSIENKLRPIESTTTASGETQFGPSCLAATSSSRLNLTEFILTSMPTNNSNCKVLSIMPISVTTLEDDDSDLKYVAILDENGIISIIDPNKCCKCIEFNSPSDEDKFVQMIYCYGIDKICAVTQSNKLYLISTRVHPIVSQTLLDEISDSLNLTEISSTKKLLVDAPLDGFNLSILHNLSLYDTAKANFSAKLPSCWSLVLAEQHQQRKHPQHILAESNNYTKCWKYLNNTVTNPTVSNENLTIEIYLNKPIQIGCIQIKLKFNKELTSPFELSVFRQKRIESGKLNVDSTIDFNLNNKQELIYGPIDIREYVDTSNTKSFLITLCSPKLYETRSNLFYLNLRTTSQVNLDDSPNKEKINLLQKIQITIRKYRRNGLQYETIERSLMLTKPNFFNSILSYLFQTNSPDNQIKVIDLINWLFYNYSGNSNSEYLRDIFKIFEQNLEKFLIVSYVNGTRSKSRKATLLLTFLLSPFFDPDKRFASKLLNILLNLLTELGNFQSSSSMNWFFVLLHQCMYLDVESTHLKCLQLLNEFAKAQKYSPYYALLNMRFNFSGLIFEPKLFDLDSCLKFDSVQLKTVQNTPPTTQPTTQISQTASNPFTFSFGSVGLSVNQQTQQSQPLPTNSSHNLFPTKETPSILSQTSGLIEVLPLSYKSISSSNGSNIEKNGQKQDNSLYILPDYFSIITNPELNVQNQDPGLDTNILSSIFTLNPVQYMVIDRMEPMSKHFVILDFGYPICLSDIKIPACSELSSISVDIWLNKEQKDSKRLCLSTDINTQSIVLSDLQPPPVCRYIKLIFVANSTNIVKARIPLGYYFGHPYIFTNEQVLGDQNLPSKNPKQTMSYLSYLEKLYEDSKCHYSISINKLKDLLNEIQFPTDNIGHLKMMQFSDGQNSEQIQKIKDQYNECLDYQFKLNLNSQLIKKLRFNLFSESIYTPELNEIKEMSEDHLRVSNSMLIKTLLCLSNQKIEAKLKKDDALRLFNSLCVNGSLDKECSWLLIRLCQNEEWWGEFIKDCLKNYFVNQIKQPVHLSKIFVSLNEMCLKSLNGKQGQLLFNSLIGLVEEMLQPLNEDKPVEVTCLEWILLFISRLLCVTTKNKDLNRWEFLENIHTSSKNCKTTPAVRQKTKYRKHLWKNESGTQSSSSTELGKTIRKIILSRDLSLRVCKLIGKLLVASNSFCSSDLFVLSCRIISNLCCNSQPSITLSEVFEQDDLNQLILLNVSSEFNHGSVCWGSPWINLICFISVRNSASSLACVCIILPNSPSSCVLTKIFMSWSNDLIF